MLNSPGQLEYREVALGTCLDDEIYCETIVTAISPGTELSAFHGQSPLRSGSQYPRLQGYCNVAKVLETGKEVKSMRVGDRVLTFQSHRSSFISKEKDILYVLRKDQNESKIVCSYLYHLGYNAVLRSNVKAGSRVLVIGMGVLGATTLQMCKIAGATTDALTDQILGRDLAKRIGADNILSRKQFDQTQATDVRPAYDVIISTVNGWEDWRRALIAAGKFATIATLGFPGRGHAIPDFNPLDPQLMYTKQLRIEAVGESPEQLDIRGFLRYNERDNLRFITDCIDRRQICTEHIASTQFDYENIRLAYDQLSQSERSIPTALIYWNDK